MPRSTLCCFLTAWQGPTEADGWGAADSAPWGEQKDACRQYFLALAGSTLWDVSGIPSQAAAAIQMGVPFHLRFQCQSLARQTLPSLPCPTLPRLRCGCGCGCTPCGNKYPPTPLLYSSSCALVKCQERNVHFWQFQFIRQPVAATPPPRRRQNLTLNILPPEYPAHMATLTRTPNKTFSTEPKNKVKY